MDEKEKRKLKKRIRTEIPYFAKRPYIVWESFGEFFIQELFDKTETFGNVYKIDFKNKMLIVNN